MSSLVPGYMTVSWTVSPPAVGVRATCGVEGWPEGERGGFTYLLDTLPRALKLVRADINTRLIEPETEAKCQH